MGLKISENNLTGRPRDKGNNLFSIQAYAPGGDRGIKVGNLTCAPALLPVFETPSPFVLSPITQEATSIQGFPPVSDPDGNPLTFYLRDNPPWVSMSKDTTFMIHPPPTTLGPQKFIFTAYKSDYGGMQTSSEIEVHFDVVPRSSGTGGPSLIRAVPPLFPIPLNSSFILDLGKHQFFSGEGVKTEIQPQIGATLPPGITINETRITGSSAQEETIPLSLVAKDLNGKRNFQNFVLSFSLANHQKPVIVNSPDPIIGASSGSHFHWEKKGIFDLPNTSPDLLTIQGAEFTISVVNGQAPPKL